MKEMMKKVRTFLTFDRLLEINYISKLFAATHSQYQQIIPEWGHTSTRQKLIANYWIAHVSAHFVAIISLPILLSWVIASHSNYGCMAVALIVVPFCFIVMLVTNYWPSFASNFLPKLEAVMATYQREQQQKLIQQLQQELSTFQEQARKEQEQSIEHFQKQLVAQQEQAKANKEQIIGQFQEQLTAQQMQTELQRQHFQIQLQEKLAEQQNCLQKQQESIQNRFQQKIASQKERLEHQQEAIKKCRQAQLSNFALTLIYYAFAKSAGNSFVESNDHTANLLLKLYGVDRGSLRTNLELIAGSSSKRKNLGERKCTEIRNRFEEARSFFKEMDFQKGTSLLLDLEIKILGRV
jgi:hypothetical protein